MSGPSVSIGPDTQASSRLGPDSQSGSRLEVQHLAKSYGSRKVVKDVSLEVQKGEVVGLLGPNGAGKTTSFYMIVGLVRSDAGDIRIAGQSVAYMHINQKKRLGLSYLPQEASIFRKLTVEENVRAVLSPKDPPPPGAAPEPSAPAPALRPSNSLSGGAK